MNTNHLSHSRFPALLLGMFALLLAALPVGAVSQYWDSNGTTTGAGATPVGTWGSSAFWNTLSTGGAGTLKTATITTDTLFFSAGTDAINPYAVGVNGAQVASAMTVQSSGALTFTSSVPATTISLGAAAAMQINSGASLTIGTNVTVQISSANHLQVNSASPSAAAGTLTIEKGGQLIDTQSGKGVLIDGGGMTVNVNSGGSISNAGNQVVTFGQTAGSTVTLNVQGGTVQAASGSIAGIAIGQGGVGVCYLTSGTMSMAPGALGGLKLGNGTNAGGTFHLDGGTLSVTWVTNSTSAVGSGTNSVFLFNGGTLKAVQSANIMFNLTNATVQAGGAIIDDGGFAITIGQALLAGAPSGGLTKLGAGTLTLTNSGNTYTGTTTISNGVLALGASGSLNAASSVSIVAGATFDVSAIATYTWGASASLSAIGSSSAAAIIKGGTTVNVSGRPVTLAFIPSVTSGTDTTHPALNISAGSLTVDSSTTFTVNNNNASALGAGDYTLITGTVSGTPTTGAVAVGGNGLVAGGVATVAVVSGNLVMHVNVVTVTTTTLTRTAGSTPSTYGDSLTFHAVVSPDPGNGSTVTFYTNGVSFGTATTTSGAADLTLTKLAYSGGSSWNVTATFAGSGSFAASTSGTVTHQVNRKALTISSAAAQSKIFDGTSAAVLTGSLITGSGAGQVLTGDTVTLTLSGTFSDSTVADGKSVTSTSTIGGASVNNYSLTQPTGLTASIRAAGVWSNTAGGDWSTAGNWDLSLIPAGLTITADFNSLNLTADTTVNLTAPTTIGTLIFGDTDTSSAAGWTLANNSTPANTLTVTNVTVNALGTAKTATISAIVAGTTGLTKIGSGVLTLSGDNTYSGATVVNAGALTLAGNRTTLAGNGTITVGIDANVATLNIQGDYAMSSATANNNNLTVGGGALSNAVVNHSSGHLKFANGAAIFMGGGASGSVGVYNFTGGRITVTNQAAGNNTDGRGVVLGLFTSCTGIFNQNGGVLDVSALTVGRDDTSAAVSSTTGIFNQTAGTTSLNNLTIGTKSGGSSGVGIFSVTGGMFSSVRLTDIARGNSDVVTMTIGGTADVTLPAFPSLRGTGATATMTFDGGTLRPYAATNNYLTNLTHAYLTANGANLNVANGNDIAIVQVLENAVSPTQAGVLTKSGVGKLTLLGANTYSGNTTISNGTLALSGAGSIASSANIILQAGATNDVTAVTGGFALNSAQALKGKGTVLGAVTVNGTLSPGADNGTLGTLTFNSGITNTSTATNNFRINKNGITLTSDQVAGATAVTANGVLNITASGDALADGDTFTLFNITPTGAFTTVPVLASGSNWWTVNNYRTISINVWPTAGGATYHHNRSISFKISITNLLSNVTVPGSGKTITLVGLGSPGNSGATLQTNSDWILYTPGTADTNDSFAYSVSDGRGGSATGTVTVIADTTPVTGSGATPTLGADGNHHVTFYCTPGYTYVVQRSPDLSVWDDVQTNVIAPNGVPVINFTNPPDYSPEFYRLKWQN